MGVGGDGGDICLVGHEGSQPWLDCPSKILRFSLSEMLQMAFLREILKHKARACRAQLPENQSTA